MPHIYVDVQCAMEYLVYRMYYGLGNIQIQFTIPNIQVDCNMYYGVPKIQVTWSTKYRGRMYFGEPYIQVECSME